MNVLILGSGGREHAISWKLAQSNSIDKLFIAPGNAGTQNVGVNVDLSVNDFDSIADFALSNNVNMIVVGPEDPLVNGVYDYFSNNPKLSAIKVVGPSKEASKLEGSKEYAKEFMKRHNIPTAGYESFTVETLEKGYKFLESLQAPYVLKADGLAAGKGVLILEDLAEAKEELRAMLEDSKFGEASRKVVIEEFLDGIELSVFAVTDGKSYKILPNAKDYKRIGEGDTGLNTGGMGAVSPVPFANDDFMKKIEDRVVKPTIDGFAKDGLIYKGFVFFGLIKVDGEPQVIEYNVRMGDPETEVVIPRIKSDLLDLLKGVVDGDLDTKLIELDEQSACTVMMVSGGYPEAYEKGKEITGLDKVKDSIVFHAGTKSVGDKAVTAGGRVLAVTSYADNFKDALAQSYKSIENIKFEKQNFRTDLGFDL
ncbi:MAG: phosphoribosylamine--glycine ligase [Ichthyobacteriaceae bacterium]|nr:phosphoribosylamine--glycine ligase [Ichthyobacteriaceae bacterium]